MAETDAEGGKSEKYARFRRFVGQTPDGGYREFRGTPGTKNVAEGVDVFELVKEMMGARIENLKQILAGWEVMKDSVTPNNAGFFYNEMVGPMESLMMFEVSNSSEKNSWAVPKDRTSFAPYLSDTPVLDGMADQDSTIGDNNLKLLCGDFVTERLRNLYEEVNRNIEQRESFEESSGNRIARLLAAGRGETIPQVAAESYQQDAVRNQQSYQQVATARVQSPEVPPPPQFTHTDFPALPATTPRVCRGVGVTFNTNRQPTITGMGGRGNRVATPAPPLTRTSNANIRPLMSLDVEPPAPSRDSGDASRTDEISRFTRGFASAIAGYLHNLGERSGRRRGPGPRTLSQRTPTIVPALTNNDDSGLNTTSTNETSTNENETPEMTSSTSPTSPTNTAEITEHEEANESEEVERSEEITSSGEESLAIQIPNPVLNTNMNAESNVQPITPRGPSYAAITSNTSSSYMPHSSRMHRNISTFSSDDFPSLSIGAGCSTNPPAIDEWVEVKSKHVAIQKPVESAEKPLIPVQSKPAKEERQTVLAAVADAWDNPEEEDPERERERERRRLKNKNQRAAKKQRDKEAKRSRAEDASTSEVTTNSEEVGQVNEGVAPENEEVALGNVEEVAEAAVENGTVDPNEVVDNVAGGEPAVAEEDPLVAGQVEKPVVAVEAGYYDETGRYCDNSTLVEPEGERLRHRYSHLEGLHAETNTHCKILFRILWFQNHHKIEKVQLDEETKKTLKERLVQCRKMMERIDVFGRLIMYRCGKQNIAEELEENILQCGKNLLSIRNYNVEENVNFARQVAFFAGRLKKSHKYHAYIFKILSLGTEFIPMLNVPDDRIARYEEIVLLAKVHVARVSRVYQELESLYRFQSVVIPQENRSYRHL